ncbi:MAG: LysM peptidoglycan-binding domain-containing protein, partial [Pedobacter sp.]|nr:LysM peptidoglycan-binding domain-containing protein [Pedobacter sp.]
MQTKYLSAIILLALSILNLPNVHANTPKDSIGVENIDGLKVIIYKASAKETYYSIARQYNVSPKEVLVYNDSKYLKIGTIIKVPTKIPFNNGSSSIENSAVSSAYFTYTIAPKDNLNFLAEKYGTTIDNLKELNGLTKTTLSIGQLIKIPLTGKAKALGDAANAQETVKPTVSTDRNTDQQTEASITYHVVKPKEFLNKIAENYRTTVEEIKKIN